MCSSELDPDVLCPVPAQPFLKLRQQGRRHEFEVRRLPVEVAVIGRKVLDQIDQQVLAPVASCFAQEFRNGFMTSLAHEGAQARIQETFRIRWNDNPELVTRQTAEFVELRRDRVSTFQSHRT